MSPLRRACVVKRTILDINGKDFKLYLQIAIGEG
jgi:hypothetical protein